MEHPAPHCELRGAPQGDGDGEGEALREGRIDLRISNTRPLTPQEKVQHLFSTTFVGLAREDHPLFDGEINARGPIDTALNELGLERRVSMIAPSFHAAMFALADSDLLLPVSREGVQSVTRLGPFTLPTLTLSGRGR